MIGHNSEPLLKQLFLLISKEGKNHFILIIFLKSVDTELKFPRIVATDLEQHDVNIHTIPAAKLASYGELMKRGIKAA